MVGDGGRLEAAGWDTTGISSTGSGCLVVHIELCSHYNVH